jgi:hypothetical protein
VPLVEVTPPAPPPPAFLAPPDAPPEITSHSIDLLPLTVNVPDEVKVWYVYPPEVTIVPPVAENAFDF